MPVNVFTITGNLLPTSFNALFKFFSFDIKAVFGVGILNFSNKRADVSLLSQVNIADLVFNINAPEF